MPKTAEPAIGSSNPFEEGLKVEVWTNKGKEGLIFAEGDTIEVHVRSNRPCNIRLAYHLADGRRILPTGEDSDPLEAGGATPLEKVWVFECSPPFGAEFLYVFASTATFERVDVTKESGYWVLNEETKQFVSVTRGIKPLQPKDSRAEASLMLTTLPRNKLPQDPNRDTKNR